MAVCYVCKWYIGSKQTRDIVYYFIVVNHPNGMCNIVGGYKIIYRLMYFFPVFNQGINFFNIPVGQKNITGLCTACFYMIDAILFLFGPRKFMFLYNVIFIIIYGAAANQAGLAAAIHYELVDVVAGLVFPEQYFLSYKCVQVFFCLFIYFV